MRDISDFCKLACRSGQEKSEKKELLGQSEKNKKKVRKSLKKFENVEKSPFYRTVDAVK